jgi:hypothetical protein
LIVLSKEINVKAADLLEDLSRRGFTLAPEADGVRVTPASGLSADLRQAIQAHKPALLALLRPWDQARAAAALAEAEAAVDRLERASRTDGQRRAAAAYRAAVRGLHARRDPLLFDDLAEHLGALAQRWARGE